MFFWGGGGPFPNYFFANNIYLRSIDSLFRLIYLLIKIKTTVASEIKKIQFFHTTLEKGHRSHLFLLFPLYKTEDYGGMFDWFDFLYFYHCIYMYSIQ